MWTALQSHHWGFSNMGWNWPYYPPGCSGIMKECVNLTFKILQRSILLHVIYFYRCLFSPSTEFKPKFDVERKDTDSYNASVIPGSQQQHPPPLVPLPAAPHPFPSSSSSSGVSGAGGVPVATSAHLPDSTTDSWSSYYSAPRQDGVGKPFSSKSVPLKQRCRDYDGKRTALLGSQHFFVLPALNLFIC